MEQGKLAVEGSIQPLKKMINQKPTVSDGNKEWLS